MTGTVTFVHGADLHLDAPFSGVDATDPRVRDALVASTLEALDRLVDLCVDRRVDFLVLAGDVYNQSDVFLRTEFAFQAACGRLAAAHIPVFIARGNHDPANRRSSGLAMPEGVHVFSEREVERVPVVRDGEVVCALYGRSFQKAAEMANLALEFARDPADPLAIGVLHTNVGGRPGHEPYAPCSVDDLLAGRMDYWALGHIHKPEVLLDHPQIAYSGSTQGLDPSERGARGCRLVILGPEGAYAEFVPTASVLWNSVTLDTAGCGGVDDLRLLLGDSVETTRREAEGLPSIVRIELVGRGDVHGALQRPAALADLLADVRASGLGSDPWVWVDRIADRTRPSVDLDSLRQGEDFAADLVRLVDALIAHDEELLAFSQEVSRSVLGALDLADIPRVDAVRILESARDLALDRLLSGEER